MLKTVGKLLRNAREEKNLSLEDVEKETRVRKKNLQAVEDEIWDTFPSKTYIQGVISTYGKFLGLDTIKLLAYFRREYEHRETLKFKSKATKEQFTPQTVRFLRIAVGAIFVLFALYFGYQLNLLFTPPEIKILEPKVTAFTHEKKILLRGQTKKETIISINGERIYLLEDNTFEKEIPLTKPENKIVIEAVGANGKEKTVELIFTRELED